MRHRLLLSLLLPLLAFNAGANELHPFHVQYRLYVSKIPTTIKADLWLKKTDKDDQYQMDLAVKSFLVSNYESSTFTWNDCQPRTSTYQHKFRGFGKRRSHEMTFSWSPPQVVSKESKETHVLDIKEDTLDDLTLLLKARCVLETGDKEFHATSAYGNKLRKQHMQVIGREIVDTPIGKLECLIVEKKRGKDSDRKTLFWVAPALDYLLVKAKHIENRALFGELMMRDYEGPPPTSTLNSSSDENLDENEETDKTVAAVADEPEPAEKNL